MAYNPKDFYFKKAKEKNYAARSVFKLEELDAKFRLFKPGLKLVDLGCAPGSWSQYATQKIGNTGKVIGFDLQKVGLSYPNAIFIQGDAFDETMTSRVLSEHGMETLDLVLSDMAPKTTGIRVTDQQRSYELCLLALKFAQRYLKPRGDLVVKIFQSEDFQRFVNELKTQFERVEIFRPKSTRKTSFEIYILGLGFKK